MEDKIISKDSVKAFTDTEIKICYYEYMRRWRKNNKDKVRAINREHYNKHYKKSDSITNDPKIISPKSDKTDPQDIAFGRIA